MSRVWHRVKRYVQYDLKEIVNPSSLPNPPDYVAPDKLTWQDWRRVNVQFACSDMRQRRVSHMLLVIQVIREGNKKYWDGWRSSQEAAKELHEIHQSQENSSLRHELSMHQRSSVLPLHACDLFLPTQLHSGLLSNPA